MIIDDYPPSPTPETMDYVLRQRQSELRERYRIEGPKRDIVRELEEIQATLAKAKP